MRNQIEEADFFANMKSAFCLLDESVSTVNVNRNGNPYLILTVVNPERDGVPPMPIEVDAIMKSPFDFAATITAHNAYVVLNVKVVLNGKNVEVYIARHPDYVSFEARIVTKRAMENLTGKTPPADEEF